MRGRMIKWKTPAAVGTTRAMRRTRPCLRQRTAQRKCHSFLPMCPRWESSRRFHRESTTGHEHAGLRTAEGLNVCTCVNSPRLQEETISVAPFRWMTLCGFVADATWSRARVYLKPQTLVTEMSRHLLLVEGYSAGAWLHAGTSRVPWNGVAGGWLRPKCDRQASVRT
jgi:hypothetical protein